LGSVALVGFCGLSDYRIPDHVGSTRYYESRLKRFNYRGARKPDDGVEKLIFHGLSFGWLTSHIIFGLIMTAFSRLDNMQTSRLLVKYYDAFHHLLTVNEQLAETSVRVQMEEGSEVN
jgi:hypothetical protein